MSKFFYVDKDKLAEIDLLMAKQSDKDVVVLNKGEKFSDIVRYNSRYDTVVFLTVSNDKLSEF